MLELARLGQRDFFEGGDRRLAGLHNAVTSGRSVTFVLQNLRGKVSDFDSWYEPVQSELREDRVCKWFVEVRNRIEKEGTVGTPSTSVYIAHLDVDEFRRHAPVGTKSTFIGDSLGRSGWVVELPDGTEHTIYFELPPSIGSVELTVADAPDGRTLADLLENWLSKLGAVVERAIAEFGR